MGELFAKGGNVFWVAPSGGRDRPDETGEFVVAPFDPKVLDMFKILAMQAAKPLSFYPMVGISYVYKCIACVCCIIQPVCRTKVLIIPLCM